MEYKYPKKLQFVAYGQFVLVFSSSSYLIYCVVLTFILKLKRIKEEKNICLRFTYFPLFTIVVIFINTYSRPIES